jgi:hypothetical protein
MGTFKIDLKYADLILEALVRVAVTVEQVHHLHSVQLPLLVIHLSKISSEDRRKSVVKGIVRPFSERWIG